MLAETLNAAAVQDPPANYPDQDAGPAVATPGTARLARELGVDLASIAGSGQDGMITSVDVQRAATDVTGQIRPPAVVTETHSRFEERRLPPR